MRSARFALHSRKQRVDRFDAPLLSGSEITASRVTRDWASMGLSLLVVDDETNFLILIDIVLSREGYQVTAARNAERAVCHLAHEKFDLAILDINMYPMNGVELLAEIKGRSPSTQVVMVTGYPTDHTRDESIKLGAAAFLTKPVDIADLKAVLRHLAGDV